MEKKYQVFFKGSFVSGQTTKLGIEISLDDSIFSFEVFKKRKTPARRSFDRAINLLQDTFRVDTKNKFLFYPTQDKIEIFIAKIRKIDRRVGAIVNAPLSARSVQDLLNISAEECRLWTKSGKLLSSTKVASARTKRTFTVTLYAPSLIHDLTLCPDTIESWRRE